MGVLCLRNNVKLTAGRQRISVCFKGGEEREVLPYASCSCTPGPAGDVLRRNLGQKTECREEPKFHLDYSEDCNMYRP